MRRQHRPTVVAMVVLVAGLVLGGCSGETNPDAAGPTTTLASEETGPPVAFVAVGSDETLGAGLADGLRDGWTHLLFREHLPRRSVHLNLASTGTTAELALEVQVPLALEVTPTLVTVWLAGADAAQATPVSAYERDLEQVVRRLQSGGTVQVVVMVGPPIEAGAGPVGPYNAAAERVVGRTGAALVDLRAVNFDLGVRAQRQVAAAVAEVLAAS